MSAYRISYVVTTYNKLPYLQQVMGRLVATRQPDEEIVVCDGGSRDGTPEYLRELHATGQIQQFVSERDKGESHGFNKGMLMARGTLLKIITDDDAFHYPTIRRAADFMLANPHVDVLTGETWLTYLEDHSAFTFYEWALNHFEEWRKMGRPGTMIGLPFLVRRSSLALTGLFNPNMVQIDGDYAFRITSLPVNIAWMTAAMAVRIENPQSNARNMQSAAMESEVERMLYFYDRRVRHDWFYYLRVKSKLVQILKKPFSAIKRYMSGRLQQTAEVITVASNYVATLDETHLAAAFKSCDAFMDSYNEKRTVEFLLKSDF